MHWPGPCQRSRLADRRKLAGGTSRPRRGRDRRWARTMASVGIRKRVSGRTGRVTYQVWWLLDDGSQGAQTVATPAQARELQAEKQLEIARGSWLGRRRGRLTFDRWADEWWAVWSTDPDRSPTTLAATENRLRRHIRPWFGQRPLEAIQPTLIRQWQNQLASQLGHESLMACRSILFRILQLAEDEGAIAANPVRKVPAPKRRADPDRVFADAKRRALSPEEAGRLLARFPLFWWDHVLCLLGTGLRFGEFAGLRLRRVHLDRVIPVMQVVDTRYQAGRFGSGFKPRPKSDAGIREVPLAPLVVEAIRRQLPPESDGDALVFTGPGGGNGVPFGTRTILSRHGFRRLYQNATHRARPDLGHLQLRGPHDLRHSFSTWLEDEGIPARVIDELMGHQRSHGGELEGGSRIGARYRHTTSEMAARVIHALDRRLMLALQVAEQITQPSVTGVTGVF
jgi:integrase